MRNKPTLSIAPYYGGKGRMAHFLVDRLNYRDTNAFISPFGGMCRVLLNKPRHNTEIYNDLNPALCTLMDVLSKPDMADEMIERLYRETEFSREEFEGQKKIYDSASSNAEQEARIRFRRQLIEDHKIHPNVANTTMHYLAYGLMLNDDILLAKIRHDFQDKRLARATEEATEKYEEALEKNPDFAKVAIPLFGRWATLYMAKVNGGYLGSWENDGGSNKKDLELQLRDGVRQLLINNCKISKDIVNTVMQYLVHEHMAGDNKFLNQLRSDLSQKKATTTVEEAMKKFYKDEKDKSLFLDWVKLYRTTVMGGDLGGGQRRDYSDIEITMATFYVFQCSRDGMGQVFSEYKFKDTSAYLKRVMNLYKCAERLEGVEVAQGDAKDYFRHWTIEGDNISNPGSILNQWINDPGVMMVCDPSYISPESERKFLKNITIDPKRSLSEQIFEKYNGRVPKNLGNVYYSSFGYEEQENSVRWIQNARCRIMVCNYDLELYNRYLNESTGWHREEFYTTTSVGGKADNKRVEVVWYNY